jgi:hypothetical protein
VHQKTPHLRSLVAVAIALGIASTTIAADPPSPEQLIERAIAAQGGEKAFRDFGVLKLTVDETETKLDGTVKPDTYTSYVDTTFRNARLELANGVVAVKNDTLGWATINGKLDQRNQTPRFSVAINTRRSSRFCCRTP